MKIVFIIPNMTGGGTERVISLLANEYSSRGIDVTIMMFAGDECAYTLDPRVELLCVSPQSHGNPLIQVKRLFAMRKYFKKNQGAYIFSFSVIGTVFGAFATTGLKCPMLVSERNDPRQGMQGFLRDITYYQAKKIVVQTNECIGYFPEFLQKKAIVISNPIDLSLPEPVKGDREKTVAFVGRLHKQKNPELLLYSFSEFVKDFPDYTLHMYGKGEKEEELKQLSEKLGITKQIVWHGFCPDVKERIVKAGMFVQSSDFEGVSNSMLEAMAMGIPVIATDCPIGGAATYINNGENGLLVPVNCKEKMVEAMKKIAGDRELQLHLASNAANIRQEYPTPVIADKMLQAVESE